MLSTPTSVTAPRTHPLRGRRPIPLAAWALALGACGSEENPTAPSVERVQSQAAVTTYTVRDLGTLGGDRSDATDINGAGVHGRAHAISPSGDVVGFSGTPSGETHAVLWRRQ